MFGRGAENQSMARPRNFHRNQKVRNKKTNSEKKNPWQEDGFWICLLGCFSKMRFFNSKQNKKNTHITHHPPSIFRFLSIHPITKIHQRLPMTAKRLKDSCTRCAGSKSCHVARPTEPLLAPKQMDRN